MEYWRSRQDKMGYWRSRPDKLEVMKVKAGYNADIGGQGRIK